MLKIIVVVIVILVLAVLIYAATRPDAFRVERTAVIKAPPGRIFALLEDLHRWAAWSPWEKKDPMMKRTFSGAEHGVGAKYEWRGNREVGQGAMEITESVPPARLVLRLDFIKPFEGHNVVGFALTPEGEATRVVWSIAGPSPFMTKLMDVFLDLDKMIGRDFEEGLANLRVLAEGPAPETRAVQPL